jgi:hypothetical protein
MIVNCWKTFHTHSKAFEQSRGRKIKRLFL